MVGLRFLHSLRARLLLLVFFASVPAFVLTLHTGSLVYDNEAKHAREETLAQAKHVAADENRLVEGTRALLVAMSHLPQLRGADPACGTLLLDLLHEYPIYKNLRVAATDGEVFCAANPGIGRQNVAHQAHFQRALQQRGFAAGDCEVGYASGAPSVAFGYPVFDDSDQIVGVAVAVLDPAALNQYDGQLDGGSTLDIYDRNGTLLVHYPESERQQGRLTGQAMADRPLTGQILTQGQGVAQLPGPDGVTRLYSFAPILAMPGEQSLYVAIGTDLGMLAARGSAIVTQNLIGLAVAVLLALAAAWFGSAAFIARPVNALLAATKRLTAGDLSSRTGLAGRPDELGRLAGAFDEMAAGLEERTSELRAAEARYRTLVEQIPAITYRYGLTDGATQYLSPQTETVLGFKVSDWLADATLWPRQLHPEDRERALAAVERCARTGEPLALDYRLIARDGRVVWFHDEARVLRDEAGRPAVMQGVALDVTQAKMAEEALARESASNAVLAIYNAQLLEQVRAARDHLQVISHRLVEAQEAERKRIAQELHDEVGQILTGLKIVLEMGTQKPDGRIRTSLAEALDLADELMVRLRGLSLTLRPAILDDLGLLPALLWHLERFTIQTGVHVDFGHVGLKRRFAPEVETAAYRIVQEALTNVARHARVSEATVRLWASDGTLDMHVEDRGIGFDAEAALASATSNGLAGMRERASLLGGQLTIESAPGRGTCVSAELPIEGADEEVMVGASDADGGSR